MLSSFPNWGMVLFPSPMGRGCVALKPVAWRIGTFKWCGGAHSCRESITQRVCTLRSGPGDPSLLPQDEVSPLPRVQGTPLGCDTPLMVCTRGQKSSEHCRLPFGPGLPLGHLHFHQLRCFQVAFPRGRCASFRNG